MRKTILTLLIGILMISNISAAEIENPCQQRMDKFFQPDSCAPDFINKDLDNVTDLQNYVYNDLADRLKDYRQNIRPQEYQRARDIRDSILDPLIKKYSIKGINKNWEKQKAADKFREARTEVMIKNLKHQYHTWNKQVEAIHQIYEEAEERPDIKPSDIFDYNFQGPSSSDKVTWEIRTKSKEIYELHNNPEVEYKVIYAKDTNENEGTGNLMYPENRSHIAAEDFSNQKLGENNYAFLRIKSGSGDTRPLLKGSYDYGYDRYTHRDEYTTEFYELYASGEISHERFRDPLQILEKLSDQNSKNPFYETKAYETALKGGQNQYTNWNYAFTVKHNGTTATGQLFTNQEKNISAGENYSLECDYFCYNRPTLVADITDDNQSNPIEWEIDGNYTIKEITEKSTGNTIQNITLDENLKIYSRNKGQLDSQLNQHRRVLNKVSTGAFGGGIGNPITGGFFESIPGLNMVSNTVNGFVSWIKEVIPLV